MAITYRFGQFGLDAEAGILSHGTEPTILGQRAVALLRLLLEHAGAPVSKDALIETAWAGLTVEESNLTVQIAALRRVLSEAGGERWIETLPRRGYRFIGPVSIKDQGAIAMPAASDFEHKKAQDDLMNSVPAEVCERLRRDGGSVFPAPASTGDPNGPLRSVR